MKMRPLGKTGIMVSEIGLGCEHLQGKPYEQIKSVLDAAEECGINAMDTFMSQMEVRRRHRPRAQGAARALHNTGAYRLRLDGRAV